MANKALTGLKNKNAGAYFEKMILASCRNYLDMGIAKIDKAHEPMKVIKSMPRGQYITRILIRWHMTGCKKRSLMRC